MNQKKYLAFGSSPESPSAPIEVGGDEARLGSRAIGLQSMVSSVGIAGGLFAVPTLSSLGPPWIAILIPYFAAVLLAVQSLPDAARFRKRWRELAVEEGWREIGKRFAILLILPVVGLMGIRLGINLTATILLMTGTFVFMSALTGWFLPAPYRRLLRPIAAGGAVSLFFAAVVAWADLQGQPASVALAVSVLASYYVPGYVLYRMGSSG